MKVIVGFARIFVGILFIISGFVKLNDPVGFSYKLQEYFSPGVLDIPFLVPFALALAVFLVIVELLLGLTLILGYLKKPNAMEFTLNDSVFYVPNFLLGIF